MTGHVLVVDDVLANRRLLEARLGREYYQVTLASGGEEAIALARGQPPDIILLDVMMPDMDGFETCRRLKAMPATEHIPVVMVTALSEPDDRVRGLECGADDFLTKPVDDLTLFARLRALLRTKQVLDAWRMRAEAARGLGLEPPARPAAGFGGSRALLFDEHDAEVAPIAAALALDGVRLDHVASSAAAQEAVARHDCDLVLVSLSLPEGGALRFASGLRARMETRDVPLLLLADDCQREMVLRAFDLGANDHLLRPLDGNELRARVRNQIRRMRYQAQLRDDLDRSLEMAVTDPLTGLRNRRYLMRHLAAQLVAGGPVAALMVDVDRFKSVNDSYGHPAGDSVLREVAGRLRDHLRGTDIVGRYGGEEFLVVMAAAAPDDAVAVADRLRQAIADAPFAVGGVALPVTASLGVAFAHPGLAPETLIGAADAALYRAKAAGRNRVESAIAADWAAAVAR